MELLSRNSAGTLIMILDFSFSCQRLSVRWDQQTGYSWLVHHCRTTCMNCGHCWTSCCQMYSVHLRYGLLLLKFLSLSFWMIQGSCNWRVGSISRCGIPSLHKAATAIDIPGCSANLEWFLHRILMHGSAPTQFWRNQSLLNVFML